MTKEKVEISTERYRQYMTILEDWIPKDAGVAVAVGGHYIYYVAGIHTIPIEQGQVVQKGSIAEHVISHRCKFEKVMDQSLIGIPYYGIGYPIDVDGEPGALVVILPPNYHVLRHEPFRYLTGKQEEDWSPIPIEQISHIESLQKKTWFYADDEQYSTNFTLKDLLLRLPKSYMRVHRSYIVNISYIDRISRDLSSNFVLTLKDGTELPVSQTYMSQLRKSLGF